MKTFLFITSSCFSCLFVFILVECVDYAELRKYWKQDLTEIKNNFLSSLKAKRKFQWKLFKILLSWVSFFLVCFLGEKINRINLYHDYFLKGMGYIPVIFFISFFLWVTLFFRWIRKIIANCSLPDWFY